MGRGIISIDPGLSRTGIFLNTEVACIRRSITPKGNTRLSYLYWVIKEILNEYKIDCAFIEGYAFGGGKAGNHALFEAGGVLKMALESYRIPYIVVPIPVWQSYIKTPPKTIKKKVDGKVKTISNTKAYIEFAEKTASATFKNTDEADAYFIYAAMKMIAVGVIKSLTAKQLRTKMKDVGLITEVPDVSKK